MLNWDIKSRHFTDVFDRGLSTANDWDFILRVGIALMEILLDVSLTKAYNDSKIDHFFVQAGHMILIWSNLVLATTEGDALLNQVDAVAG